MNISDYIESLEYPDEALFLGPYRCFWTEIVLEYLEHIGPETDADLERLQSVLLEAYQTNKPLAGAAKYLYDEIIRLKKSELWRDDSALGRKYRCLWAIAPTDITTSHDAYDWVSGIDLAFDLIGLAAPLEDSAVRAIESRLTAFRAAQERQDFLPKQKRTANKKQEFPL